MYIVLEYFTMSPLKYNLLKCDRLRIKIKYENVGIETPYVYEYTRCLNVTTYF